MTRLPARAYFMVCLALGWLLRTARYSTARVVDDGNRRHVEKHRRFYAPVLIRMGVPLARSLATGVRVLPQHEWEQRERHIYDTLYGESIRVRTDGLMVLPCLPGRTLASLLDDRGVSESLRSRAIEMAVAALADLHRLGFTHGDAMAENVLVDLEGNAARWFDFETLHEPGRPLVWRRADDVRALLMTITVRTPAAKVAGTVQLIVDAYGDDDVARNLARTFVSVFRRPLAFHLAQASLSFERFREIAQLLDPRFDYQPRLPRDAQRARAK